MNHLKKMKDRSDILDKQLQDLSKEQKEYEKEQ
jgi:hypothetical protein